MNVLFINEQTNKEKTIGQWKPSIWQIRNCMSSNVYIQNCHKFNSKHINNFIYFIYTPLTFFLGPIIVTLLKLWMWIWIYREFVALHMQPSCSKPKNKYDTYRQFLFSVKRHFFFFFFFIFTTNVHIVHKLLWQKSIYSTTLSLIKQKFLFLHFFFLVGFFWPIKNIHI